jgi:hypothetical protein
MHCSLPDADAAVCARRRGALHEIGHAAPRSAPQRAICRAYIA